ncbi:MAG: hypothetical protein LBD58_00955 [Treponema sp.]|jgi:hypothetical protein|nr:hypothetical protein [Treponema sp.]
MEPEWFAETFNNNLKLEEKYGALEEYRVLEGGVLIALDGVWYYSSQNIHSFAVVPSAFMSHAPVL